MEKNRMRQRPFLIGFALLFAVPLVAGAVEVSRGSIGLTFDDGTGRLVRITYKGDVIAEPAQDMNPASFAIGPADQVHWAEDLKLPRKLVKIEQPASGTVEITVRLGDYELVERYKLDAEEARLDRSASLVNRSRDTVKLRNFSFRTAGIRAKGDGFYRLPETWPPKSRRFAEMAPGQRRQRGGSVAPAAAQISPTRTLLWLTASDDSPDTEILEGAGQFDVRQNIHAAGYLRPGEPQEIGFATLLIVDRSYWAALPAVQEWLERIGAGVPRDRPAWVSDAVFYSFHPGGTIGSGFGDLGGFQPATARLVPTLERLGVNATWILPIEFRSPYWPLDYYRFMDGLGTGGEYRELVAALHKNGLRVLQDLVPHGGAPIAVHNQQHPEFMLRREDGSTLTYWLNDFARPDWQDFIANVVTHYMREYNVDGYRVDAASGSREANWDPKIPYARASMAQLWGGLKMLERIRKTGREINPQYGAVLAEVQSTRHLAFCDMEFDFLFTRQLCQAWRQQPAKEFAANLQEYFAEQNLVESRGAIWLRHTESHDTLRSELWFGVEGMRAMYALSAWIDGVPMIYQDMDRGHAFELRRINDIRRSRPELSRGEADYRAVRCDAPGVFTCLRKLGERQSVVAINFTREPVRAKLVWPGGTAEVRLKPLGYTVVPEPAPAAPAQTRTTVPASEPSQPARAGDGIAFDQATEWFVDTAEGRLHDLFLPVRREIPKTASLGSEVRIYWRPLDTETIWRNGVPPLNPARGRVGVRCGDRGWTLVEFDGPAPATLRLLERHEGKTGLFLTGLGDARFKLSTSVAMPAEPDVTRDSQVGPVRFRVVGSDYIVSNRHYTVVLRKQGGVVRELEVRGRTLVQNHDLLATQAYFTRTQAGEMRASHDVECGASLSWDHTALHITFEGQVRGMDRFGTKKPPLWYRNEYVFTDAPRFANRWAFRTETSFVDQPASLVTVLPVASADHYRFLRKGERVAEGPIPGPDATLSPAASGPVDAVVFLRQGEREFSLENLQAPPDTGLPGFAGNRLSIPFLDSPKAAMQEGRWYEFQADWNVVSARQ